ncbi:MAG: type II toxin-antitoxin system RelE/ParE family toxin [Methanobacteriota archaeon]|nr:MAG: type II toxin-antitoxin system RelE/ParE family toxin [Euryarchaeota archaeon]
MTFRVTLSETATRQLRKLPPEPRSRIVRGLRVLGEDPFRPRPKADIRPIEGTNPRKYRIRIGDYRAVYAVVGRDVKVLEVFTRGRGYR